MMQRSHLTAWQAFAPWPKQSQIEQDLRLSRGVAAIFADPVLNEHLAMRGGTVLHKAHLAPAARYSEDIDLVLVKAMNPEVLDQHLRHVLAPVLGQPADSLIADAWLAIRNVLRPSQILRTVYRFVPLGLRREEIIKVEINLNESAGLYPLVDVEIDTLDDDGNPVRATARSYDINEMLGTKTRALMQREQGRDLFDLYHAWRLSEAGMTTYTVDGAKAMDAFAWYLEKEGTHFSADEANAALDTRLHKDAFRRDMDTLLRPGLPKYDIDASAIIVREAYFRHIIG
ncbi:MULTISPECIES: nucleotidyl transferase AbiEii/AbiGii toxin family protein [Acidithiobacillus]|uniref:Nucleotidyl transferase AbiEii/AbiGii toxin family protein n=2 Tax=Acidithiobacillus TaxID=119977 RepID=A0A179BQF2_ACIFR|nr:MULTISPECIES: nucleotidyl transferase AbiEii/AbiGii toxin family protein [Acidithiobacillus]MEB8488186.1 nucleotidyl transferase AbiEii/AbiGii toxin family protein [Acidithiobacillus ferriphilus]MEB8488772.1 nucleotidyl transferase AbiEii/AbiGii toxin family protein [Acidithiobacillus ferriphilus]MEB8492216.1 nucleotidyl transferase AbiEii/AbiGii toxin family protein [Acidithiobacillus ferriphilus]MEB8513519.1 nucleotidyl transferase AbiEii/AbiGii toxin family protein [Acidithiobacillus ferr